MANSTWSVPLADILVDELIEEAVRDAVRSGWWSMGPRVEEFEREFGGFLGTRHALAVASGTAALHLALLAAGCGPGDEVVLPSLNFVAAANCVALTGATPVFCDINGPHDLNLDPADLERAVGRRTKALLVMHYGGFPCDLGAAVEIAEKRGLVLIEDAAHAPGATWQGRSCGTIGRIGCFSFFANKNLTVGEGGMVVTDDDGLAERIRLLRSHGMTSMSWDRHRGHASGYDVVLSGLNYRIDELRAAIGLVELRRLPERNAARRRLAARYRDRLHELDVTVPFEEAAGSAHHLQVVVLPKRVPRDRLRAELAGHGIQTSVHYPPIHLFTRYAMEPGRRLPRTEDAAARLVTLPLYPQLRDDQIETVVETLAASVATATAADEANDG